ncbi:Nucleoside-diphosphate-sugar epimerase [Parapedobacter luteus]|uniref:Nucleoside-diphosphate-sugar epimerase n=2 Tax=Sphingobacteriaceae TaxID=84566 RepID=A0A1T5A767_9SPHI|nr:Nucleoside-diphosphate-sugar epimerase [Parapedobacter luteus]
MGYVGPGVIYRLRNAFPTATLIGYDMGYFASCITNADVLPECKLNQQIFGDVRSLSPDVLTAIDAVVHLAAISNDPMGLAYHDVTLDVNYRATIAIATLAKQAGVRHFVFASSCSIYGFADGADKVETDDLNPLTTYAQSKVQSEQALASLADEQFTVTSLRFATACGMSDRLRLDLVLNDFVANAVLKRHIKIMSDGSPWRPLIHVSDMARAIEWAVCRPATNGGDFLAINVGSNAWNYQVKALAQAVANIIPDTTISINSDAVPDKRSYRVNFDKFAELAPDHQPVFTLKETIIELVEGLVSLDFKSYDIYQSPLIRLRVLNKLQIEERLNADLTWTNHNPPRFETNLVYHDFQRNQA